MIHDIISQFLGNFLSYGGFRRQGPSKSHIVIIKSLAWGLGKQEDPVDSPQFSGLGCRVFFRVYSYISTIVTMIIIIIIREDWLAVPKQAISCKC